MLSWLHSALPSSPAIRRWASVVAVVVLGGVFAAEVALSTRALSATWDEPYHIWAGYCYWEAADYGFNPEHPPLAKLVGAFPLLFMRLKTPAIGPDDAKATAIRDGRALVYGNNADAVLRRARLAEAVLGLLLLLLLFEAAYRMLGAGTAWLAVVLAIFEPNLIANCMVVTSDFAFTCFYLAAVYAFWRVAERPSLGRLAGAGVMVGLALASKHSALVLFGLLPLLAAVEVACRWRGPAPGGASRRRSAGREIAVWIGCLAVISAIAWVVLWAFYGFRYSARPNGWSLWASIPIYVTLLRSHLTRRLLVGAAHFKVLPESYLFGLTDVLTVTAGPRVTYFMGRLYPHALWYYFPCAFVIKSTLGFLALLFLSLLAIKHWAGEHFRQAAYLLIPPGLFLGIAMTAGTNLGIRHVLPIFPFAILIAAAGAGWLAQRGRAWVVVVAVLLAMHAASSVHVFPDYLAYSNEAFGGKSKTYLRLSDSNVDWGQGLAEARQYLDRNHIKECWLAYFGTGDPAYYHLPCKSLPDPFLRLWHDPVLIPPETYHGVVLVSGTEIAAPYWGADPLDPYSDLLRQKPAANIGGSILVFDGDVDLRQPAAMAHMYKAWDYIFAKDLESGVQEALQAQDLAPTHPGPPFILGYILAQEKRTGAARIQFEESLRLAQAAHPEYQPQWVAAAQDQLAILPQ